MAVAKLNDDGSLTGIAASFYRTFACTKDYYDNHVDDIPDGTLVFITDDATDKFEHLFEYSFKIYPSLSEMPTTSAVLNGITLGQTIAYVQSTEEYYLATDGGNGVITWVVTNANLMPIKVVNELPSGNTVRNKLYLYDGALYWGKVSDGTCVRLANRNDVLLKYSVDSTLWDTTPTANSTKPVTSGGIKSYVDTKVAATTSGYISGTTLYITVQ